MRLRLLPILPLLLALQCERDTEILPLDRCEVDAVLSVDDAAPGDRITLTGGPYTSDVDTVVTVGPVRAEAIEVVRESCADCDLCVDSVGCDPCGSCEACAEPCASCVQTTALTVPEVEPGLQRVILTNAWGSSPEQVLEVLDSDDTDTDTDTDTDG